METALPTTNILRRSSMGVFLETGLASLVAGEAVRRAAR
jgi:hypothetical protein